MSEQRTIKLIGRIFLRFNIKTRSGLHIGGSNEGISIGAVDKTVIRDPLTNRPYIPGSSLRGKMRSLTEKYGGFVQNNSIGKHVQIHVCQTGGDYHDCQVCQIYGVPGEMDFAYPTRLIVRDTQMDVKSVAGFEALRTDFPFTEVKTEVAIDRVTSAASPRQMERVPAGAVFGPGELVYSLYEGEHCTAQADLDRFETVVNGLQFLEDDYLGGLGSRGSGQVAFKQIEVIVKSHRDYRNPKILHPGEGYEDLPTLVAEYNALRQQIEDALPLNA